MARAGSERIVCRISSEKSFWGYTRHVRAGSLTAPSAAKSPWPSTRHLCTIERHIIRLMTRSLSPFGRSRPSAPADTNLRGWHFVWFSQEDSEETGIGTEFSLPVGSREPPSKPPGGARIYVRSSVHSFYDQTTSLLDDASSDADRHSCYRSPVLAIDCARVLYVLPCSTADVTRNADLVAQFHAHNRLSPTLTSPNRTRALVLLQRPLLRTISRVVFLVGRQGCTLTMELTATTRTRMTIPTQPLS